MIDSHCHLTDPRLGGDRLAEVLAGARAARVSYCVTVGTTPSDAAEAQVLSHAHPEVLFTAGIHPNNSLPFEPGDVRELQPFAADPRCVALGEMGLDYHWKDVPPDQQKSIFRAQLELAAELSMPVVIHCREAVDDTLAVLAGFPAIRCVFHCFTGTAEEARRIAARGYSLGFTGPLTFKRNDPLRDIAASLPASQILIETDAPYMTPEPFRSVKVNEPKYVRYVLEALARIRQLTPDAADTLTTDNTRRLYRWPHLAGENRTL
jgi:TatD DNase family protein